MQEEGPEAASKTLLQGSEVSIQSSQDSWFRTWVGVGRGLGTALSRYLYTRPWYLGAARIPGKGGEDLSKHPTLLGVQYLVPVEMVQLGASAAKHQSHGGRL